MWYAEKKPRRRRRRRMRMELHEVDRPRPERALLVSVDTGEFDAQVSIAELAELAAQIAISTVRSHEAVRQGRIRVIFNVFKEQDEVLYKRVLGAED